MIIILIIIVIIMMIIILIIIMYIEKVVACAELEPHKVIFVFSGLQLLNRLISPPFTGSQNSHLGVLSVVTQKRSTN